MIGFFDPFVGPVVSFILASHFKRLWIVWAGAVATGTGTVLLSVISAKA
jgi:hypothetical protein